MDYLVSAENTTYHWWQLELLIESFQAHSMEDNLVIAFATNDGPKHQEFFKNLRHHKRLFYHDNHGRECGYLPINKAHAAHLACNYQAIKQPFCIIEPDMLLVKPVEDVTGICFQYNPAFTIDHVEHNGLNIREDVQRIIREHNLLEKDLWLPLGSVYTFKNVPADLFTRAIHWTERFISDKTWWHAGKVGWAMAMLDYSGSVPLRGHYTMEMTLIDHNCDHNIIHYTNGLPPVWSKHMYKYQPPDDLCMGGPTPFDVILEHNPTSSTNYLQKIIRNYKEKK